MKTNITYLPTPPPPQRITCCFAGSYNKLLKVIFVALVCISLCFGQKPEYCEMRQATRDCLERLAVRYGLEDAEAFFGGDDVYTGKNTFKFSQLDNNSKNNHISNNLDRYKEYIHVEVINILEKKAANKKKSDFATFVANKQGEPDISAERVRNFRESGYYISDYEKYIDGK